MKKNFILSGIIFLTGGMAYSQVGINTETPKATIDIVANKTDETTAEGIIAPRLTLAQLISKDAKYTTNQAGVIVYLSDVLGTTTTKTANIDEIGYYYFDGALWQPFDSTKNGWSITGNSGTSSNTDFLGTTDAADLVVKTNDIKRMTIAAATGNVGIGTLAPHASAILDISASNKSVRVPNVALTGSTDVTTVPNPQKGMIVYNTTQNQFAYFNGTQWTQPISSAPGVVAPKLAGVMYSENVNNTAGAGKIWYDTKTYDPENAMVLGTSNSVPGKYTVQKAGLHQVYVNFTQRTSTVGAAWFLRILKNNVVVAAIDATSAAGSSACLFAIDNFVVGDVITVDKGGNGTGWAARLSKMSVFRFE